MMHVWTPIIHFKKLRPAIIYSSIFIHRRGSESTTAQNQPTLAHPDPNRQFLDQPYRQLARQHLRRLIHQLFHRHMSTTMDLPHNAVCCAPICSRTTSYFRLLITQTTLLVMTLFSTIAAMNRPPLGS